MIVPIFELLVLSAIGLARDAPTPASPTSSELVRDAPQASTTGITSVTEAPVPLSTSTAALAVPQVPGVAEATAVPESSAVPQASDVLEVSDVPQVSSTGETTEESPAPTVTAKIFGGETPAVIAVETPVASPPSELPVKPTASETNGAIAPLNEPQVQPTVPEAASPDGAAPDTTVIEAIVPETAAPEVAVPEAAVPEAAIPEAAIPEAAIPEAAVPEAAVPEAAVPEAAVPEAAIPEAVVPVADTPEASVLEAAVPETTVPEAAIPEATALEAAVSVAAAPEAAVPKAHLPRAVVPEATILEILPAPIDGTIAISPLQGVTADYQCPIANGNFCYYGNLNSPYIVRCINGKGLIGSCIDALVKTGTEGRCYQPDPKLYNAICVSRTTVYPEDDRLPFPIPPLSFPQISTAVPLPIVSAVPPIAIGVPLPIISTVPPIATNVIPPSGGVAPNDPPPEQPGNGNNNLNSNTNINNNQNTNINGNGHLDDGRPGDDFPDGGRPGDGFPDGGRPGDGNNNQNTNTNQNINTNTNTNLNGNGNIGIPGNGSVVGGPIEGAPGGVVGGGPGPGNDNADINTNNNQNNNINTNTNTNINTNTNANGNAFRRDVEAGAQVPNVIADVDFDEMELDDDYYSLVKRHEEESIKKAAGSQLEFKTYGIIVAIAAVMMLM